MKKILIGLIGYMLVLVGCDHVFEYHPYELRLGSKYKDINRKNMEWLKALDPESNDTVRFAFMGDTQRWYDETKAFVKAVNRRNDIRFVVHGGDITDFGLTKEYCWIHDIMSKLKVPYMAVIGNHDNLGSGREVYETMYGALNFSFVYGRIKFICMNTNALDYDYSVPVPDFGFIKQEIADTLDDRYDSCIAIMHTEPGNVVFNNNVKEPFHEYLKRLKNLRFCLHAHEHHLMVNDFFGDGVMYYGSAAIESRNYLLFTVTKDTYSYEVVYF